ncbi:hypothetical protein EHP00_1767 [Ecytonucleospora hepatopenaei]|uniref:Uncharacterized protein n=1 Tax=Ecytonucleospora hepatopenaei TaxID=646526 RepID=A0A1W0E2M3_9MICR|nr:hypothetical protein EHP00_1767 [Ecytonucleospora hepatopenaei]
MLLNVFFYKLLKCASNYTDDDLTDPAKLQEEYDKEVLYFQKLRELFNDGTTKDKLLVVYNGLVNETEQNLKISEYNTNLNKNFVDFNLPSVLECTYKLFYFYSTFRRKFKEIISQCFKNVNITDVTPDDFTPETKMNTLYKTPSFDKYKDLEEECFDQMKYMIMNILFISHKFHQFCLHNYDKDSMKSIIPSFYAYDFFLNRALVYFLETTMLYVKNEQQMGMVSASFTFNWTTTTFFYEF